MWWAWLAWKLDLCDDAVKQNPMISIFRKFGSLKSDRGSSPLCPPLDPPLNKSQRAPNTIGERSEPINGEGGGPEVFLYLREKYGSCTFLATYQRLANRLIELS